ncbi:uncharacterized protein LOC141632453 [Silene latifolia]|uniref:uncharacterized protein LOC141632453 n=1 Tax=Silene latifolia TaxID=37657 RepID=UPI003D773536
MAPGHRSQDIRLLQVAKGSKVSGTQRKLGSPAITWGQAGQEGSSESGGSELLGLTYSAAKRKATGSKGDHPETSYRVSQSNLTLVTFDETEIESSAEQHDDALTITLSVGNCTVRKALVDTGCSVNLIMLETLKTMGFNKENLIKKSVPLVGFSGETAHSVETRYTSFEKLALALVTASYKSWPYFESHTIHVITNYPLKTIMRKPELSGRMTKWSVHLSGYDLQFEPKTAIKSQALADFVSDFCPATHGEAEEGMLAITRNQDGEIWTLYIDGASNVRGAGVGLVLRSPKGDMIVQAIRCEFKATNNKAEYEALVLGIQMASGLKVRNLRVYSDSLLGVNHVNNEYVARDSKMIAYLKIATEQRLKFRTFKITQVPWEQNVEADALATLGSTFQPIELSNIPITHVLTPAIQREPDQRPVKEDVHVQYAQGARTLVSIVGQQDADWRAPYLNWLRDGTLPEDRKEAQSFRIKACRYIMIDNILFRKLLAGPCLRCLGKEEAETVLKDVHSGECGNHARGRSLSNKISRQGYFWPTMRANAVNHAKRLGKLPRAPGNRVYMLVMTDYFSKWIEAEAMIEVKEQQVISFIKRNIISRFGIPSEIICDNGSQFISDNTKGFCARWNITLRKSAPRYPQTNGQAESSNKIIVEKLRKLLEELGGKWADELPLSSRVVFKPSSPGCGFLDPGVALEHHEIAPDEEHFKGPAPAM